MNGTWIYWYNGCQFHIPLGYSVTNACMVNNTYRIDMAIPSGQTYTFNFLIGNTGGNYVVPPFPGYMPGSPTPVRDAHELRDDELILTLIERGYAVWKPPVGQ